MLGKYARHVESAALGAVTELSAGSASRSQKSLTISASPRVAGAEREQLEALVAGLEARA